MMRRYVQSKVIDPLSSLLIQGIPPEKLSLSLAWGITLGTLPVLGVTTALCIAVALCLRLNLVVTQIGNWVAYPLQIVMFVPFFMAGAYLFGGGPVVRDTAVLMNFFRSDFSQSLKLLGDATLHAALVWVMTAPFMIMALYGCLTPLLRRLLSSHTDDLKWRG